MNIIIIRFIKNLVESAKDIAPIVLVIAFFQIIVLKKNIPNMSDIIFGSLFVLLGLTFFIYGLKLALFPIGDSLAHSFVKKKSIFWLLLFAFSLGVGTTVAEPALIAVAKEAAQIAQKGDNYADWLRYIISISVGLSLIISVIRILKGWPIQYFIISGYLLVVIITFFAPDNIIGIAYDSGGVTTSTITVPLLTALGVGLSTSIKGRNPLIDGFGVIALAALFPIIAVMIFGIIL
jgi:hypothetical protein